METIYVTCILTNFLEKYLILLKVTIRIFMGFWTIFCIFFLFLVLVVLLFQDFLHEQNWLNWGYYKIGWLR